MPVRMPFSGLNYPQNPHFIHKIAFFLLQPLDKSNKPPYICSIKNQKK